MRQIWPSEPMIKGDRTLLVGQLFGMGERKIEEHLKVRRYRPVVAGIDRCGRCLSRHRIGGIHARGAAKRVAWKLVEQDHQRQASVRSSQPAGELATRSGLMQG